MSSCLRLFQRRPADLAREALRSPSEIDRRAKAKARLDLYRNDCREVTERAIDSCFSHERVKAQVKKFAWAADSVAHFQRVVDEVAKHVYHKAPLRRVKRGGVEDAEASKAYAALAEEMQLDARMDLGVRVTLGASACLVFPRYVARLGRIVLDVVPPDGVTVIPDPSVPTLPWAIVYDVHHPSGAGTVKRYVYWDPEISLTLDENLDPMPVGPEGEVEVPHGLAFRQGPPGVWLHRRERWGGFWDVASGRDLEAAQVEMSLLNILALRLLKAQGFNQVHASGEVGNIPKGQPLDEETALVTGEDVNVTILPLKTDASHYLALYDKIKRDTAARYGISDSRLNQDATVAGWRATSEIGLLEQRDDLVKVAVRAEKDLFEALKVVSREHHDPRKRIPEDAELDVSFVAPSTQNDRTELLTLRQTERSMLLKNTLDFIREDHPEIATEEEARELFEKNLAVETDRVTRQRALNAAIEAPVDAAGVPPEVAGRLGVMVRDGVITGDQASETAAGAAKEAAGVA